MGWAHYVAFLISIVDLAFGILAVLRYAMFTFRVLCLCEEACSVIYRCGCALVSRSSFGCFWVCPLCVLCLLSVQRRGCLVPSTMVFRYSLPISSMPSTSLSDSLPSSVRSLSLGFGLACRLRPSVRLYPPYRRHRPSRLPPYTHIRYPPAHPPAFDLYPSLLSPISIV
ncbi:hypothetical protein BJ912DRAFT_956007, partial [Pholiota molesta]